MATRPWPQASSIRLAIEGQTAKGVNWANIFWLSVTTGGTPNLGDLTTLTTTCYNAYATHIMLLLGKDGEQQRAVANYYGSPGTQLVADYLHNTAGGSANNTEVDSLSACISWAITQTWRGGKPRTYLPCLPTEAFGDSNTLDGSFITTLAGAALAFRNAVNAAGVGVFSGPEMGCMSFFSGNAPRSTGVFFPYVGQSVHPRIDSMRRRLGREIT